MRIRRLVVALVALLVAVPSWACIPEPETESAAGANALKAQRIEQGVDEVLGRPQSIPAGMGGAVNIGGDGGPSTSGLTTGDQKQDLTFDGASGTTKGTVVTNPDGSVTITPDGDTTFFSGTLSNDTEGRQIEPGTGTGRTSGGTIKLKPKNPNDPSDEGPQVTDNANGGKDFTGSGVVDDATLVDVQGGVAIIPGSPRIHVNPGKPRLDSNVVYGED